MAESLKEIEESVESVLYDCRTTLHHLKARIDPSDYDTYRIDLLISDIDFILEEPDECDGV